MLLLCSGLDMLERLDSKTFCPQAFHMVNSVIGANKEVNAMKLQSETLNFDSCFEITTQSS